MSTRFAGPPLRCGPSGDTPNPASWRLATTGRVLPVVTDRLFHNPPRSGPSTLTTAPIPGNVPATQHAIPAAPHDPEPPSFRLISVGMDSESPVRDALTRPRSANRTALVDQFLIVVSLRRRARTWAGVADGAPGGWCCGAASARRLRGQNVGGKGICRAAAKFLVTTQRVGQPSNGCGRSDRRTGRVIPLGGIPTTHAAGGRCCWPMIRCRDIGRRTRNARSYRHFGRNSNCPSLECTIPAQQCAAADPLGVLVTLTRDGAVASPWQGAREGLLSGPKTRRRSCAASA